MGKKKFKEALSEREQANFDKAKKVLEGAIKGILAMFPSGPSAMYGHTRAMFDVIARVVNQLPNRALAARRGLVASGMPELKIQRVLGASDQEPSDAANPTAPRNRRISTVVLRKNEVLKGP